MNRTYLLEKLTEMGFAEYRPHVPLDLPNRSGMARKMYMSIGDKKIHLVFEDDGLCRFAYWKEVTPGVKPTTSHFSYSNGELLKSLRKFAPGFVADINTRRDPRLVELARCFLTVLLAVLIVAAALRAIND